MAEKEEYNSIHDGPIIDAAVTQAKPGGTLDSRLRLSLYTSLEQIGVTVGSETMEAISLALPNNSILEASCGGDNNGAADGTAFPVVSGAALTSGILRVSRIGSYDRVSFEFRVKEAAGRLFVGFYSSTDGWSGWKKVYTDGSKPTYAETGAAPSVHAEQHKRGGADNIPLDGLSYLGLDIITSSENDTVAAWSDIGTGHAYFSVAGEITDQPSQYGMLLNFVVANDVFQIWRCQPGGPTFWRSGHESGWASAWAKVFDSAVAPTFTQFSIGSYVGAGGATSGYAPELTFPFTPKAVFVVAMSGGALGDIGYFMRGVGAVVSHVTSSTAERVIPSVEWGDSSLHFYTTSANGAIYALNVSGATYGYIAFG